jgi:hypothetical protein
MVQVVRRVEVALLTRAQAALELWVKVSLVVPLQLDCQIIWLVAGAALVLLARTQQAQMAEMVVLALPRP